MLSEKVATLKHSDFYYLGLLFISSKVLLICLLVTLSIGFRALPVVQKTLDKKNIAGGETVFSKGEQHKCYLKTGFLFSLKAANASLVSSDVAKLSV